MITTLVPADTERQIRRSERAILAGALRAHITDGDRERLARALEQIDPACKRILGRTIHEMLTLCEADDIAA